MALSTISRLPDRLAISAYLGTMKKIYNDKQVEFFRLRTRLRNAKMGRGRMSDQNHIPLLETTVGEKEAELTTLKLALDMYRFYAL